MTVVKSHEDAVSFFQAHGLHAYRRDWALGDTVVVMWCPSHGEHAIVVYRFVLWLVPSDEACDVVRLARQRERTKRYASLDEACVAALTLARRAESFWRNGERIEACYSARS